MTVDGELVYMAGGGKPSGYWIVDDAGRAWFVGAVQPPLTSPTAFHGYGSGGFGSLGAVSVGGMGILGQLLSAILIGVSVEVIAATLKGQR